MPTEPPLDVQYEDGPLTYSALPSPTIFPPRLPSLASDPGDSESSAAPSPTAEDFPMESASLPSHPSADDRDAFERALRAANACPACKAEGAVRLSAEEGMRCGACGWGIHPEVLRPLEEAFASHGCVRTYYGLLKKTGNNSLATDPPAKDTCLSSPTRPLPTRSSSAPEAAAMSSSRRDPRLLHRLLPRPLSRLSGLCPLLLSSLLSLAHSSSHANVAALAYSSSLCSYAACGPLSSVCVALDASARLPVTFTLLLISLISHSRRTSPPCPPHPLTLALHPSTPAAPPLRLQAAASSPTPPHPPLLPLHRLASDLRL